MSKSDSSEIVDIVIVGAGISGIGAAFELTRSAPEKSFVMIDMRDDIGGTWDLFRYPGIRSDSDMYTLGYSFRPWTAPEAIAEGGAIKSYLEETLEEAGLRDHLRLGTRLVSASFDSGTDLWTLELSETSGRYSLRCRFIYLGSGYYSYKGGFDPVLPAEDEFEGEIVHPQRWPEDLAYAGKRVAVIGSGATAITLVPSMARTAARVTMVQRSPTYVVSEPSRDEEAEQYREALGAEEAFVRIRLRNLEAQQQRYKRARQYPAEYKREVFDAIEAVVGDDVRKKHFTPTYEPWDQRVCAVPDNDLFHAVRDGAAEIVTGMIDALTPSGIRMTDGTEVDADVIVKATGLNMVAGGEADFRVDGAAVDFAECWTYKGLAYSGVPNLFFAFGFLNSSWTLRLELVNDFWVRVLERMDALGATRVTPTLTPEEELSLPREPFISDVNSSYFQRGFARFPSQGGQPPWTNPQDYALTRELLEDDPQDSHLVFRKPA